MSKYDWTNVPKEVKWIAMDKDGVFNGFYKKPEIVDYHSMWFEIPTSTGDFIQLTPVVLGCFNWMDSLEERPK
jgi:hypothetical protein